MKILVIGNGFDLEHGLTTKYKDFLDFMQGIKLISSKTNVADKNAFIEELGTITNHEVDENIKKYFTQEKFLNPDFMKEWKEEKISKELIEGANNNIWIKYFIKNMNYENKGWIDFESEISNVIQCFDYMKNYSEYCKKYLKWPEEKEQEKYYKEEIVKKVLVYSGLDIEPFELIGENLKEIIDTLKNHLDNLIRCLEIYLEECVRKINIECLATDIKDIRFDKVLSFNYTNTYERVYGYSDKGIEYDYIHGKAEITRNPSENDMVLGIDEYLDDELKNKELEFIAFKKYFQRIYKRTGNTYKKWREQIKDIIRENNEKVEKYEKELSIKYLNSDKEPIISAINEIKKYKNEIYIFGHSLDITDKDIIRELIEYPNIETTIFYYDKGVYAQQIANMVKIIGQDELIQRVSGANPTIIFKQQQQKTKRN